MSPAEVHQQKNSSYPSSLIWSLSPGHHEPSGGASTEKLQLSIKSHLVTVARSSWAQRRCINRKTPAIHQVSSGDCRQVIMSPAEVHQQKNSSYSSSLIWSLSPGHHEPSGGASTEKLQLFIKSHLVTVARSSWAQRRCINRKTPAIHQVSSGHCRQVIMSPAEVHQQKKSSYSSSFIWSLSPGHHEPRGGASTEKIQLSIKSHLVTVARSSWSQRRCINRKTPAIHQVSSDNCRQVIMIPAEVHQQKNSSYPSSLIWWQSPGHHEPSGGASTEKKITEGVWEVFATNHITASTFRYLLMKP